MLQARPRAPPRPLRVASAAATASSTACSAASAGPPPERQPQPHRRRRRTPGHAPRAPGRARLRRRPRRRPDRRFGAAAGPLRQAERAPPCAQHTTRAALQARERGAHRRLHRVKRRRSGGFGRRARAPAPRCRQRAWRTLARGCCAQRQPPLPRRRDGLGCLLSLVREAGARHHLQSTSSRECTNKDWGTSN
jgi:hypothetical protein